jgi:multiple sugar transport system ATP-binding protein
MTMGDRVAVIKKGELQQIDAPQTLYDRPRNLFVAGFIGSPAMNFLPATARRAPRGASLEVDGGFKIDLPESAPVSEGQKIVFGMRPEHFTLAPNGHGFDAAVVVVEPTGADTQVFAKVGATEVNAVFRERHDFKPGEAIRLAPDTQRMHLFDAATGMSLRT